MLTSNGRNTYVNMLTLLCHYHTHNTFTITENNSYLVMISLLLFNRNLLFTKNLRDISSLISCFAPFLTVIKKI